MLFLTSPALSITGEQRVVPTNYQYACMVSLRFPGRADSFIGMDAAKTGNKTNGQTNKQERDQKKKGKAAQLQKTVPTKRTIIRKEKQR